MRRHRDERPFQCGACLRTFTEQHALRKHLRLHTGEKPYACRLCPKTFADCSNLAKHRKVHRQHGDSMTAKLESLVTQVADNTDSNQVFYVAYQAELGDDLVGGEATGEGEGVASENLPVQTLVHILEGDQVELRQENPEQELDSLVQSAHNSQLHLDGLEDDELPIPPGQLQVKNYLYV